MTCCPQLNHSVLELVMSRFVYVWMCEYSAWDYSQCEPHNVDVTWTFN